MEQPPAAIVTKRGNVLRMFSVQETAKQNKLLSPLMAAIWCGCLSPGSTISFAFACLTVRQAKKPPQQILTAPFAPGISFNGMPSNRIEMTISGSATTICRGTARFLPILSTCDRKYVFFSKIIIANQYLTPAVSRKLSEIFAELTSRDFCVIQLLRCRRPVP